LQRQLHHHGRRLREQKNCGNHSYRERDGCERIRPASQLVFSSCADGTINVAHEDSPDKYTVVQTIATQKGARTMALDTKNHNVYTVTVEFADLRCDD
jgi:hypothetical protein